MFTLNDLNDAVDGKFVVVKSLTNQAPLGTLIHIMNTKKNSDNSIKIDYRVTSTSQDFIVEFNNVGEFNKWIKTDNFLARNYESFSPEEIKHYIKIENRSFATFCLPILIVVLAVIWGILFAALSSKMGAMIGIGAVLSLIAFAAVTLIYKKQKSSYKLKLMAKAVKSKWKVKVK